MGRDTIKDNSVVSFRMLIVQWEKDAGQGIKTTMTDLHSACQDGCRKKPMDL